MRRLTLGAVALATVLTLAFVIPIQITPSVEAQVSANLELGEALLEDATTGSGCKQIDAVKDLAFYYDTAAGVTAGAVQIEEEYSSGDATTLSAIGSATTLVADSSQVVTISRRYYRRVCARISTTVSGGGDPGVTVYIAGQ